MATFSARVAAFFEVEIEAEDAYEADEKLRAMRAMDYSTLRKALRDYPFPEFDIDYSDELPEEL